MVPVYAVTQDPITIQILVESQPHNCPSGWLRNGNGRDGPAAAKPTPEVEFAKEKKQ